MKSNRNQGAKSTYFFDYHFLIPNSSLVCLCVLVYMYVVVCVSTGVFRYLYTKKIFSLNFSFTFFFSFFSLFYYLLFLTFIVECFLYIHHTKKSFSTIISISLDSLPSSLEEHKRPKITHPKAATII